MATSQANGKSRILPPALWTFSDDTQTALSVYETLHPNGIAGAIAVAVAPAQAYHFSVTGAKPDTDIFWNTACKAVPDGELKNKLQVGASLNKNTTTGQAAKILGCGWDVSARGDADTSGAMVGGIIAAYGAKIQFQKNGKNDVNLYLIGL